MVSTSVKVTIAIFSSILSISYAIACIVINSIFLGTDEAKGCNDAKNGAIIAITVNALSIFLTLFTSLAEILAIINESDDKKRRGTGCCGIIVLGLVIAMIVLIFKARSEIVGTSLGVAVFVMDAIIPCAMFALIIGIVIIVSIVMCCMACCCGSDILPS